MKRPDHNAEELLKTFLGSLGNSSQDTIEASRDRLAERFRAGDQLPALEVVEIRQSRGRAGFRFAVAAVLVMSVAIGVYAFRAQRASSPNVVVPAVQSSAATEPKQVAAVIPGSTKPVVAPSREEILAGVAAQIAAAQNSDLGAARPKFAAASIRPVEMSPLIVNGFKCLGSDGLWVLAGGISAPPARGRCVGDVVELPTLLFGTYSSNFAPWTPLTPPMGLTRNIAIMNFQINAVAENPERVTKAELRLMLQSLIEDRFKARVHLETRQLDGYVLTIAKSGIKFKEASGDQTCGGLNARPPNWRGKCRMETLTTFMSLALAYLPVADKTGLTGLYDINLLLEEIPSNLPPGERGVAGPGPQPRQFTTPLAKALEDQLGLHLERGKVPVEHVVVDHIEAPTEN
jgi:uncharacterized protein (TIGR03435 family)